jgi:hypothetical protein
MSPSVLGTVASKVVAAPAAPSHEEARPDLPKLIECRGSMANYMGLAAALGPDMKGTSLGWRPIESGNPFLTEFELPKPIKVFGVATRRIALGGSGVLAILDKVKPEALATKLGLQPVNLGAGRSILAKVVEQKDDDVASTIIRLNVSMVDSHPGKVLAGCEYRVTIK